MMPVLNALDHGLQLAFEAFGQTLTEQIGNAIGGEKIGAQLAGPAEDGLNGPTAFEDEIAAVLDLADGIEAVQAATERTFFERELGSQDEGPMVDALLKELPGQAIGSGLEHLRITDGDESVVVLVILDFAADEFAFDKIVAVEIPGDVEGQERAHAQHHRPGEGIEDVEVIVGVATALLAQDSVVGVLGWEFRMTHCEGWPLLHAAEDEIDAEAACLLAGLAGGRQPIFLADAFLGPQDGDAVLDRIVLDPALVVVGSLAQKFLGEHGFTTNVAEEVDDIALAGQEGQIAVDDNAIKAMVKPLQERFGSNNLPTTQISAVSSQLVASAGPVDFIPSASITLSGGSYYVVAAPTTSADNAKAGWVYTVSTFWKGLGTLSGTADKFPGYWEYSPIGYGPFQISVQVTPK